MVQKLERGQVKAFSGLTNDLACEPLLLLIAGPMNLYFQLFLLSAAGRINRHQQSKQAVLFSQASGPDDECQICPLPTVILVPHAGQMAGTDHRSSRLMLAIDVACLVVQQLCIGDVKTMRKRGRTHDGYRKLADHPDLPMSKSTLWRYVRVYELTSRMPWVVASKLTVAHLTVVLGLDAEEQERVLRAAEEQGWSSASCAATPIATI